MNEKRKSEKKVFGQELRAKISIAAMTILVGGNLVLERGKGTSGDIPPCVR